ncbi:MAG: LytTR family DNA-binding domain-containing protein [Tenuifilaceae bacterium]|jgi:two-component system LytT family response regulator|nr:LytTR family DNA-binding domain-containing protein [Tenuifilaceae bacterium]
MISAVIIDDEKFAREALANMLKMFCPDVNLIGEADGVESGVETIRRLEPDAVFLDIQMPDGSGFDLLKEFASIGFKFVFITAYQEYAIQAFKYSAIDYILKPIDPIDLAAAVEKLHESVLNEDTNKKFQAFIENIQWHEKNPQKIVLKTFDTVIVAEKESIIRCESENNYTMFYFTDKPKVLVSKTLKEFDVLLSSSGFFRVHQSHLVNLNFVAKYNRFPDSHVVLTQGQIIPVSVRKRELLVTLLKQRTSR